MDFLILILLSGILLVVANVIARWWCVRPKTRLVIKLLSPLAICLVVPVLLLQAILLAVAAVACRFIEAGQRSFLSASVVATLLSWGLVIYHGWPEFMENHRLRQEYPFESLTSRLLPIWNYERVAGTGVLAIDS